MSRSAVCATILVACLTLASPSCSNDSTRPRGPCYTVSPLFSSGLSTADTTTAHAAFDEYLQHLSDTGQSPAFGFRELTYLRAGRLVDYKGFRYWGIVARGARDEGSLEDSDAFSVRDDGTVVLFLGCI